MLLTGSCLMGYTRRTLLGLSTVETYSTLEVYSTWTNSFTLRRTSRLTSRAWPRCLEALDPRTDTDCVTVCLSQRLLTTLSHRLV